MALLKKRQKGDELQLGEIKYPWAIDLLDQAIANTWFPHEAPMAEDLKDWAEMTEEEKHGVELYIGFSNPMEYDVNDSINNGMKPFISAPEVQMCLVRQEWEEVNHALTFDYIINTLQIDRQKAFNTHNDVPEVKAKEEFLLDSIENMAHGQVDVDTPEGIRDFIKNIVKTNIVTEGIWFHSGFMFALSFRQRNKLRNFGTLTDWIARDEALHLKLGINIILTVLEENPEVISEEFAEEIKDLIREAVELEIKYNNALLPKGILGLNKDFVTQYVRFLADRRLEELGFEAEYKVANPAKWMTAANDTFELINFFETVNTAYEVNAGGIKGSQIKE
ncbi:MAG: ribonucleotide-diphosphate reductase subunit beta [Candidatus Dojkabacteria bacterium]